jgi:hypothetical protein
MAHSLDMFQLAALRENLAGRRFSLCYGGGVDSTALLIALHDAGLRPEVITFANVGNPDGSDGEKPETLEHVRWTDSVLARWGWPAVSWVRHNTLASTPYTSLAGNCVTNETLPSLAFGMHSCSVKWKIEPQQQFLMGVKSGPNKRPAHPLWLETQAAGERIVVLIGYDSGKADVRRSKNLAESDAHFDYAYPLQLIGWVRSDCVAAIINDPDFGQGHVPIKSACYFCPASKPWELFWLAAHHPELFNKALAMERGALVGHHSRFDKVEFGADWEDLVRNADRFPSSNTTVGLGRKFAWNHWARINGLVDGDFKMLESERGRAAAMAEQLKGEADNALDGRSCGGGMAPAFKGIAIKRAA